MHAYRDSFRDGVPQFQTGNKKEGCLGEKLQSVSVRVDRVSAMGADGRIAEERAGMRSILLSFSRFLPMCFAFTLQSTELERGE